MNKIGYIYLIINLLDNKKYVGQTTKTIKKRFKQHCYGDGSTYLSCALKKYGIQNFKIELLHQADDICQLDELERYYIKKYNTLAPKGYNLTTGGNQCTWSRLARKRLSAILEKWTYDDICKIINENGIQTRSQLHRQFAGIYKYAQRHKLFDKLNLPSTLVRHTLESAQKWIKDNQITALSDLAKLHSGLYSWLYKNNLMKLVCRRFNLTFKHYYRTYRQVIAEARCKNCQTKAEFQHKCKGAYLFSYRRGWLPRIYKELNFPTIRQYHTYNYDLGQAVKYNCKSLSDFKIKCYAAYQSSFRHKWHTKISKKLKWKKN